MLLESISCQTLVSIQKEEEEEATKKKKSEKQKEIYKRGRHTTNSCWWVMGFAKVIAEEAKRRKMPKMMKEHWELAKMFLGASISAKALYD